MATGSIILALALATFLITLAAAFYDLSKTPRPAARRVTGVEPLPPAAQHPDAVTAGYAPR